MNSSKRVYFTDAGGEYIYGSGDGVLDIVAATSVDLGASVMNFGLATTADPQIVFKGTNNTGAIKWDESAAIFYVEAGGGGNDTLAVDVGNQNVDITEDDDGSAVGPILTLHRESASPAQDDLLGAIYLTGKDDQGVTRKACTITAKADGVDGTTPRYDGTLIFSVHSADGVDESLRCDGTNNYIGIRQPSPGYMLDVYNGAATGTIKCHDIWTHDGGVHSTSDERLKENIENSDLGLDFIKSLRPVKYKWKDKDEFIQYGDDGETVEQVYPPETYTRTHYGLISQEVKQTLEDSGKTAEDFGGYTYTEKEDVHGLRYSEFISPLIKAMQEQQEIIEKLLARVEELEKKIE